MPPSPALLAALLICPLCAHALRNPTTLLCAHSICAHHLNDNSIPCPVPRCQPSTSPSPHVPRPDVVLSKILALIATTQSSLDDHHPRPRKRHKPQHDHHHSDHSDDLLSHLRSASAIQRLVPPDVPLLPLSSDTVDFDKKLQDELTCHICYLLFHDPVTTPCQHTFCAKCLQRSLDHNPSCPICRQQLPSHYFQDQPINKTILAIIVKAYPLLYQERKAAIEQEERHARLNTPIFVCNLSFPGVPTLLHFFEPRYRLMLRRCLESPTPRFGMVMSPKPGSPQSEYGTMLEIRSVQTLPDGRSMVETCGSTRFRILERGTLDGYMVGRIERIIDFPDDPTESLVFDHSQSPPLQRQPTNAELIDTCKAFLDRLQRGAAPWVVQRLSSTYGAMPSDPALFSFWVALVLPIEEHEKAKLLPIRSPRLRLMLVVHWIEQLNSNWYAWLCCFVLAPIEGWLCDGPPPLFFILLLLCCSSPIIVLTLLRLIAWI